MLAVLLLLGLAGYLLYRREARELHLLSQKRAQLRSEVEEASAIAARLPEIVQRRDSLQGLWEAAPKKILNVEEPAFSLSYLNWLINMAGLSVDFDFHLNDSRKHREFSAFSYTLAGEGSYRNLCGLVWYLAWNPLIYQIKSVSFKRSEADARLIDFVMKLEGCTVNPEWEIGRELSIASPRLDWTHEFSHDAFSAAASAPVTPGPEIPERSGQRPTLSPPDTLPDIRKATLLAIANNKAYFGARDGRILIFTVGDRVSGGRITQVDARKSQVQYFSETAGGEGKLLIVSIRYN